MKRGYFDPLYKVVVLQDPVSSRPRSAFSVSGDSHVRKAVTPLIDSFEFTRLSRLRQSGLLYLVFPSATHTRFAHSLGCCHLGFAASASVKISDPDEGNDTDVLGKWLGRRQWEEEFLIALLLHDLGHFAFSHLIEGNTKITELLGVKLNHEEVACDIILGRGLATEAMSIASKGADNPPRIRNVIENMEEASGRNRLEVDLLCYLITGNEVYLQTGDDRRKRQARILHALTSGLLDLDRIDHYRRDSEFTGLEIGFNYQALLHGLTIEGTKTSPPVKMRLDREAVGHALSLLHMRERLTLDCFLHPKSMSLDAMCNWSLGEYLDRLKASGLNRQQLTAYLLMGDDELLGHMRESDEPKSRLLTNRLAAGQVFDPLGCWELKASKDLSDVLGLVNQLNSQSKDLLLYKPHPALRKNSVLGQEWLDLECLLDEDGKRLGTSGRYANQIAHFKKTGDPMHREVWFFCENVSSGAAKRTRRELSASNLWERQCSI